VVTTINTTLLALTAASRVTYGMARAGALPRPLALVHRTRRTPVRAVVTVAVVAAAFAALGNFAIIAAVADFAVYVVFLAVNGTVIILRRTRPELRRSFAVPWVIGGVPVVPMLARFGSAHDDPPRAARHCRRHRRLRRGPGGRLAGASAKTPVLAAATHSGSEAPAPRIIARCPTGS
jgi:hypothetical protein